MDATNAEPESTIDTSIASSVQIRYKQILVPHDRSEMADNALKHAIYISNISEAEIIILNVVERLDSVDSSAVLATSREGNEEKRNNK
jgi:nucleotide-binding universal stress UspA family protein